MKRVNLFFIAAFVAASSLLVVSCGEDDDDPDNAPTIEVKAEYGNFLGSSAKSFKTDATIEDVEGMAIGFDVTITMGKSKVNLITFTSKIGSAGSERKLVDIDKSSWTSASITEWTYSTDTDPDTNKPYGKYYTNIGSQGEVLTFQAEDKQKRKATVVITLKVKAPDPVAPEEGDQNSYYTTATTSLGAQSNATYGSFYNAATGKVMFVREAGGAPATITFVCCYASAAKVTSPTSSVSGGFFSYNAKTLSGWTGTVATSLKKAGTPMPDTGRDSWWNDGFTSMTETDVTVAVDDVIFFKQGTAQGAFIVKVIPSSASGQLDVQFIKQEATNP